jgi:hypothetical protein
VKRPVAAVLGAGTLIVAALSVYLLRPGSPEDQLADQWAMIDSYCVDCHNKVEFTGDLSLEGRDISDVHEHPAVWEKVVHKLNIGLMPPREMDQPDPADRAQFLSCSGTLCCYDQGASPESG